MGIKVKQFDRQFLEEYRRIPKKTNSLYQNYYNPTVEGGFTPSVPTAAQQLQPQAAPQIIERWPEGYIPLLPKHMQGYNSTQVLDELQKSYQGNQNLSNQRNIYNNNLAAERTAIDKKGQEEFRKMQDLAHQLSYYPTMSENLKKHSLKHLEGFHVNIIANTPNKSQFEANEALRQKYGNRFPPINISPQDLQRYGIVAYPPNTIKGPPVYTNPYSK